MKTFKSGFVLLTIFSLAVAPLSLPAKDSASLDLAKQLNQAFIEVAEKVSPSVVVINVTQKLSSQNWSEGEDGQLDMIPREFRRYFRRQAEEMPQQKPHGQGSGIIVREDGYILTNRHVVEDAEKIEVRLKDGRRFKAEVRGADPQSDIAVIKIDAKGLPAAKLADSSQVRVGEFAIAIGAPFSFDYSVTFGHVSAKGRSGVIYDPSMDQDFIQTDANINPGNSGGPLVNINGEVIGINTLIRGMRTGIGFAIPVNLAREVSDKLISDGKFTRSWLGIGIRTLRDDPEFRDLVTGADDGVVVVSKVPDGPAAKSDLKPTDVITAVDGKKVATAQQLKDEIRGKKIGQSVTLDVVRNGKTVKVKIKPGEWSEKSGVTEVTRNITKENDTTGLGVSVQTLTKELADQFDVDLSQGVIVTEVTKGSIAERKDIKPGDIITEVNQHPVTNPKEFRAALKGADLKKGVILNLISGKSSRFEILKESEE